MRQNRVVKIESDDSTVIAELKKKYTDAQFILLEESYGAWILVYERANNIYQNDYIAKVKVTTDGFSKIREHFHFTLRAFGLFAFMEELDHIEAGMFFVGRLISAWFALKNSKDLDPHKHFVKIKFAEGYCLPKGYLQEVRLKQYIDPFKYLEVDEN